jgi:hypothetical protein
VEYYFTRTKRTDERSFSKFVSYCKCIDRDLESVTLSFIISFETNSAVHI